MISRLPLLLSVLVACSGGAEKPAETGAPCDAPTTWYADADGDGYGDPEAATTACAPPDGAIAEAGDCDDGAADVHPGAKEIWYDGADEDCSGGSDFDQDGDGYDVSEECDDLDASRYPDPEVVEIWYDGVDQDCDGNDGDQDGDGWYAADYAFEIPAAYAGRTGDCWDDPAVAHPPLNGLPATAAADVHPTAPEAWYDGIDGDCAGDDDFDADADTWRTSVYPDEAGTIGEDCADADASVHPGAADAWYDGTDSDCAGDDDFDADRDGYRQDAGDCDDTNGAIHPDAVETCATGADDNCDGSENDPDALGCTTFYEDADGDGYGDASACLCAASGAYTVTRGGDCDDTSADRHPGATELCDGIDQDCDGNLDNGTGSLYADADRDGYGDASGGTSCSGVTADHSDCNDRDGAVHPGAAEVCDGADQDCDGTADDGLAVYYPDADGDGWGAGTGSCAGSGTTSGSDCDDADRTVYPGATELCDGQLNDCSRSWSDSDEDGTVTVFVADGTVSDVSAYFASGTSGSPYVYTARDGARLAICRGHWYARVSLASSLASAEIVGPAGSGSTTLDGAGTGRVIDAGGAYGLSLTVEGLTLTGGTSASGGGIAVGSGTLTVDDVVFDGNWATGSGGGLYMAGGSAEVTSSSFVGNSATNSGGAIEADTTTLILTDVRFEDNYVGPSSGAYGGALRYYGGAGSSLQITGSTFTGNYASASTGTARGGAAYLYSGDTGTLTLDATTFDTSQAIGASTTNGQAEGGAVYLYHASSGAILVSDLDLLDNDASGSIQGTGGALYLWATSGGVVTLSGLTFDGNTTASGTGAGYGGGAYVACAAASMVEVVDSTFNRNVVGDGGSGLAGAGGGLAATLTGGRMTVTGTSVTDNQGSTTGGLSFSVTSGAVVSVSGATLVSGSTGYGVGVEYHDTSSSFTLADSLISGGSSVGLYLYASGAGTAANATCQGSPSEAAGIYGNASYGVFISTGGTATATYVNNACDYNDPSSGTGNGASDIVWGAASYDYGVDASPSCALGACTGR